MTPTESWEKCKLCETPFQRKTPWQLYCNYRCTDAARYYRSKEKRLAKDKKRHDENYSKESALAEYHRKKEREPEKLKARQTLRNAIATGKIERRPCEVCDEPQSQGHHEDYTKPLEVIWLCNIHHHAKHRKYVGV